MSIKLYFKWTGIILLLVLFVWVYKNYNPMESTWFPKCPFRTLTGLLCPGCGSQRAIHNLLNLDVRGAFEENALLVLSIPYLLTGLYFELVKPSSTTLLAWRQRLFGQQAIKIILVVVICFWVLRNLL